MKELSIEEKAKRYDEVVERAKIEKEKSRNLELLEFIDENFPELTESEDERVRKALIDMVECAYKKGTIILGEKEKENYINWLEKQGEPDMIPLDKVIKFLDEQLVNDKTIEDFRKYMKRE